MWTSVVVLVPTEYSMPLAYAAASVRLPESRLLEDVAQVIRYGLATDVQRVADLAAPAHAR